MSELQELELSSVEAAVGTRSFGRGKSYARGKRVFQIEWDAAAGTLSGAVVGNGALYRTSAFFSAREGALRFDDGECTCPVAYNCKHVAAIVIAASDGRGTVRSAHQPADEIQPDSWERPLRALLDAPATDTTGTPLAIELALQPSGLGGGGALRLTARLLRAGARGGWVKGSVRWSGLDSWSLRNGDYRQDHLALAEELLAVYRASRGRNAYLYSYGADRTLDLSDCGAQLWLVLDEAARIGLTLVDARPGLGEIARYRHGELVLDVTRSGEETLVTPAIHIDGGAADLVPLLFLGSNGHGIVCADAGARETGRLHLVRLERPAAPKLQNMVVDGAPLEIPASGFDRFAEELCPALRSVATVVSSDTSFIPPEISVPSLVLRVRYGEQHAVDLGWEWAYEIGKSARSAPFGANAGPGFRDLDAERAILAATDLTETGLERFGLIDEAGRPVDRAATPLTGLDSMRLVTEGLPQLAGRTDVTVEIAGEGADYRDVGESLEIGLATADIVGERDWFDLGVTIGVEGRELPFAEVFVALASGESHLLLEDGAYFSLLAPRLQSLRQLIEEARDLTDSPSAPLRISRYQAGLWAELAALGIVTEQAQAWKRQATALLDVDALADHEPPAGLAAELRPYQREGFNWLASLWDIELGGILADDMGLGKTLQALALMMHARDRDPGVGPFLVVAPTSVVPGWVSEAARFAPELRVEAVTDTMGKSGGTIAELAAADVVVTTYTLLRLDFDAYRTVEWSGLILDEAQYVKNHQAKTYRCARELAVPFKLAITGTPMENNLMELWSLLSISAPGLFPEPKRFSEQYARPIERGDTERLERLRRRIKPLVKRRTKELVASELPAKHEQMLEVDLHPRHRKLYDMHLHRERQKILGLIGDFNRNRFTILRSITLLRQLSLHPALVDGTHDATPSAKLGALVEHLADVVGGGHRALVFSQFTGFLAKVRDRLEQEGIGYCYLDGRTRRREQVLERFRTDNDPVFLISLKAGGFGLNLTEADYCFMLDPWWNPAVENQAIDRTHRIGQTRPVMVYRVIARDTIEEKVVALASRKAALFRGVMDEGDLFASTLTAEDVRALVA